mmetsp:Transcript_65985/g.183813  ORF Transcript_65985/g.183813 Transcript_65985/m.183813 type:complete len:551 (-) Transcript_65985:53-1705(-)
MKPGLGEALHDPRTGIPPENWCVTKADLKYLRRAIAQAIHEGKIRPVPIDPATGRGDPFNEEDDAVGPNMYSTVASYIKPVTRMAGNMSWALMRNPSGLKCDIFITHCWAEGAFELIDKVLASWPPGKHHAWCCALAIPQNLDVSFLISEPRRSPFARALDSASHVMVVSNQACGIYTRIWCVYEAYLAYTWEKTVFTANAPIAREVWNACTVMLACAAAGAVAGAVAGVIAVHPDAGLFDDMATNWIVAPFVAIVLIVISQCVAHSSCAVKVIDGIGMALMSCYVAAVSIHGLGKGILKLLLVLISLTTFALYFVASEVDRLRRLSRDSEAKGLRVEYTTIDAAQSSCAKDKERILSDIGNEGQAVDSSIRVLISAGMSTPGLRRAALSGVNVSSAADLRFAVAWLGLALWILSISWLYMYVCPMTPGMVEMFVVNCVMMGLCILLWIRSEQDRQALMGSVATKLAVVPAFCGPVGPYGSCFLHMCCLTITGILTFLCSVAGMGGIAQIPYVGPNLAGILGPGCHCRRESETAGGEDDEEEDDEYSDES